MRGSPIQEIRLRDALHTDITYSPSFEEYLSCVEAKLDYARWEGEEEEKPYSPYLKAKAIVGYRMKKEIEAHIQDVQNMASRKAARKK
jgi:hypothetical protein